MERIKTNNCKFVILMSAAGAKKNPCSVNFILMPAGMNSEWSLRFAQCKRFRDADPERSEGEA
jgi:hypothetical protein